MQGEGNMKSIAISQIIEQFLNVILSLLCAFILMGISMPYGVAGDLLKSDVSNAYGNIYSQRYEQMKQQLDSRYSLGFIEIGDGI